MKNSINGAWRQQRTSIAMPGTIRNAALLFCSAILMGILFTGCQKIPFPFHHKGHGNNEDVISKYHGLSQQTKWELEQVRAATAKYKALQKALDDGYSNINVDVENMGHHFMKMALVDATFDVTKPEILVYSGVDEGEPELVAVEYATNYFTDASETTIAPTPEGFTGNKDVWKGFPETGFKLWLVHAWIWKYNPDGVFAWNNPLVEGD